MFLTFWKLSFFLSLLLQNGLAQNYNGTVVYKTGNNITFTGTSPSYWDYKIDCPVKNTNIIKLEYEIYSNATENHTDRFANNQRNSNI